VSCWKRLRTLCPAFLEKLRLAVLEVPELERLFS